MNFKLDVINVVYFFIRQYVGTVMYAYKCMLLNVKQPNNTSLQIVSKIL